MIKAIIFDWGGVMIDTPANSIIEYCAERLGVQAGKFERVFRKHEPPLQKGIVSEKKFWQGLCAELGVDVPKAKSLWGDAFRASYREKKDVFALASKLRCAGYKIALLSNTECSSVKFFREHKYRVFDATIFSCEEKSLKPEREIYKIALQRLGVKPAEAVFIDDKEKFVEGARAAGINAIRFQNIGQLKGGLAKLGVKTP